MAIFLKGVVDMETIKTGWNLENSYSKLPELFYTKVKNNSVSKPELVIINDSLAKSLGLNLDRLKDKGNIDLLAGNTIPESGFLLAQAYAGHQFGNFTMLGDGRAMLIGEQLTPKGRRFDIQVKGSGRTPYSRGGDGRASLGAMLREYIISEGMHNLGIPTTRSLAVVATGDKIYRESSLPGAILTRVAASHIRVGTFEYAAGFGSLEELKALADYSIKRHFPNIRWDENPYLSLLKEVIKVQASLIAKWQLVGFIHGVMNTDNMTISGETIDYGPCAFMDSYKLERVFSSIDRYGRYAYGNQPNMAKWNLARFAETLLVLIDLDKDRSLELAQDALEAFDGLYYKNWLRGMRSKLGIFNEEEEDEKLIEELLNLMEKYESDYTNLFIGLSFDRLEEWEIFLSQEFKNWNKKWKNRLKRQEESRDQSKELMKRSNPAVIPRNHLVEEVLSAASNDGNYKPLYKLLDALSKPYEHVRIDDKYTETPKPTSIAYKTYCGT